MQQQQIVGLTHFKAASLVKIFHPADQEIHTQWAQCWNK